MTWKTVFIYNTYLFRYLRIFSEYIAVGERMAAVRRYMSTIVQWVQLTANCWLGYLLFTLLLWSTVPMYYGKSQTIYQISIIFCSQTALFFYYSKWELFKLMRSILIGQNCIVLLMVHKYRWRCFCFKFMFYSVPWREINFLGRYLLIFLNYFRNVVTYPYLYFWNLNKDCRKHFGSYFVM